jgi:outer membrane murein-binding lipoprotein Lpp|tara:strand:+ start:105 stop:989 length:885 start_codon:yes stop_codon:yes gene_type:complete
MVFMTRVMMVLAILCTSLPLLTGCQSTVKVELLPRDLQTLKALEDDAAAAGEHVITTEEIVERIRDAEKWRETKSKDGLVYTFLRKVVVEDLSSGGEVEKRKTKTYRAFSDNSNQVLLLLNGRKPTQKEIEANRKENRKRQHQFLNSEKDGKGDPELRGRKFDFYRDKFVPRLISTETIAGRPAYIVQFVPDPSYKLENAIVDRMMNQMLVKAWIDQEEFQVAKAEIKLTKPISFLAGIAASLREIKFTIRQKRVTPEIWVDQNVSGIFDVRILFGTYRFRMNSESTEFRPAIK